MPHISLKNIPECFKKGELYISLLDNDSTEEIELPEKYSTFAIDFKICEPTIKTIIYQLETVQFWCIYEIPFYVFDTMYYLCGKHSEQVPSHNHVDFSIFTRNTEFINFLEIYEYKKEIEYMINIDTYSYHPLIVCSICGFQGYFKYLHHVALHETAKKSAISKKWGIRSKNKLLSIIVGCQKHACEYGQVDMLKILFNIHLCENLFPILVEMAAKGGNYKCMKYLFSVFSPSRRIKWTKNTCYMAAKSGNLECLKYVREKGAKWDYFVACAAAEYGNFDCFKYLYENGCPLSINKMFLNQHICNTSCYTITDNIHTTMTFCMWKHNSCNLAAANGHYNCLKYAWEHNCYMTNAAIVYAAKHNHEKCLYYLIDIKMREWTDELPYLPIVISFIIKNNRFDILQNIYEKYDYCPFDSNHPNQAAITGNIQMLMYIIDKMKKQDILYYDNICRNACLAPSVNTIKQLHKLGFTLDIDCLYEAAEKGNHEIFVYVLDYINNIKSTNDIYSVSSNIIYRDLVKRGDLESLKYYHTFKFPISKECIWYCIISGDYPECLGYLFENIDNANNIPVCLYSAKNNQINCVKIMHETYKQSLDGCLYWSIFHNNINLLQYVWEKEKKNMTWVLYQTVVKKKYTEIRIFIEKNININKLYQQTKHMITYL